MKRFRITITSTNILDADELWPDGDAPADPCEEDVRRLVELSGGEVAILDEWNLAEHNIELDVAEV